MGVIVAIDFGTSRTAYAWTQSGIERAVIEVGTPEGSGALSKHDAKTPTNLLLDGDATKVVAFGQTAEDRYIKEAEDEDSRMTLFFRWFKMRLHKPGSEDPMVMSANGRQVRLSLVLAKALEFMKGDAVTCLNNKGMRVSAKGITWVITVPAIWSDWAKNMMRNAAYDAGMIGERHSPQLRLALEPECACISLQIEQRQAFLSDVGAKLLIVDCGGGTVDITAHEVLRNDPLQLKELIVPDGGPLGATRVDEQFFYFFKELVGFDLFNELKRSSAFLVLNREWENKKVAFTGMEVQNDGDWWATLCLGDVLLELELARPRFASMVSEWNEKHPKMPAKVRGKTGLSLSFALIRSFFDGPIQKIVQKTREVIQKHRLVGLDYLVLTGGFARSPLLQNAIRSSFQSDLIRVVVSSHPDLAIVKGAAAFGARPSAFASRKAKYTYGVCSSITYNASDLKHRQHAHKRILRNNNQWCLPVFSVHGRVGDDVDVGSTTPRRRYLPFSHASDSFDFKVLVSPHRDVFMSDEADVRTLCKCKIFVDMSLAYEDRAHWVEFSFGDTETLCNIFHNGRKVHNMVVNFPTDVHWIS